MSKTIVKNDDNSQHKKIEKLIKEKLDKLKEKNENMDEIKKFNLLYELIKNPYEDLFDKVSLEVAMAIFNDLGIPEKDRMKTYQNLIRENIEKCDID